LLNVVPLLGSRTARVLTKTLTAQLLRLLSALRAREVTFAPGNRLAVMLKNSVKDVSKMLLSLELEERYSEEASLDKSLE
jgi:hypothetical protein